MKPTEAQPGMPQLSTTAAATGRYAMSTAVYEAEDTVMGRVVAVKLLAAPYSENQVFSQRLYREARAAERLH
jgi:serine/threonine protein kinase